MTTAIKRRRGTTTQHSTFTGLDGEITIDTTKKTVVVHDGSTAGGTPLAKESAATSAVAITGGTINGTTIGATTASTGAFTTLSTSSTTTLSGLTASTALALDVSKNVVSVTNTGTGNNVLSASPTLTGTIAGASLSLSSLTSGRVTYAGASGLLSDSANLTYGTGLSVNGISQVYQTGLYTTDGALSNYSVNNGVYLNGNTTGWSQLSGDGTRASYVRVWGSGASPANFIVLTTAGSERMRVDSSGNVGIGTSSPTKKLTVSTNTSTDGILITGSTNPRLQVIDTTNSVTLELISGDSQSTIRTDTNHPLVFGTNGTERMTLTAAGNLGIGTSSPTADAKLSISNAGAIGIEFSVNNAIANENRLFSYNRSANVWIPMNYDASTHQFLIGGSEKMRITSTGNLAIGTTGSLTGSSRKAVTINCAAGELSILELGVNGTVAAYLYTNASQTTLNSQGASPLTFETNGSERMRIDSSGNLLIGTTSGASAQLRVHTAQSSVAYMQNSLASPNGLQIYYSNATAPNSVANEFLFFNDTSATRMTVRSNGGIANYTANNVILSDSREKTNFAPSKSYLDVICAIPVQTFNYIDQNLETDAGLTLGVVAQDVQAVAPELVSEGNWGSKDQPKMRLEIYQTDLQYALMKALQELKAEFDAYKATHP